MGVVKNGKYYGDPVQPKPENKEAPVEPTGVPENREVPAEVEADLAEAGKSDETPAEEAPKPSALRRRA